MRKYIKGKWHLTANEDKFNTIKDLKYKLNCLLGLYANDITITEVDLEMLDDLISEINLKLRSNFEELLQSLQDK